MRSSTPAVVVVIVERTKRGQPTHYTHSYSCIGIGIRCFFVVARPGEWASAFGVCGKMAMAILYIHKRTCGLNGWQLCFGHTWVDWKWDTVLCCWWVMAPLAMLCEAAVPAAHTALSNTHSHTHTYTRHWMFSVLLSPPLESHVNASDEYHFMRNTMGNTMYFVAGQKNGEKTIEEWGRKNCHVRGIRLVGSRRALSLNATSRYEERRAIGQDGRKPPANHFSEDVKIA